MKAFLIDPTVATITEIDYDGDWMKIGPLLGCVLFTTVILNHMDDVIFVDDEGLINGNPHGWFSLAGYHQPLKGKGLVLGTDLEGESIAPRITLEDLHMLISFPKEVNEAAIDRRVRITPI